MKRIALIMLIMLSVQSISAQRYERPSIHYSKEETYEYLKDYVGLWQFKDTLERLVFKVELVTNDTGHRIILKGRYSILKDGVYITNEFNDENLVESNLLLFVVIIARGLNMLTFFLKIVAIKIEKRDYQNLAMKNKITHTFTPIRRIASGR